MKKRIIFTGLLLFMLGIYSETSLAQVYNSPSSVFKYNTIQSTIPKAGYMTGGEFWQTVNPMNSDYASYLGSTFGSQGANNIIMAGTPGAWTSPTSMWPGGYRLVTTWRSSPAFVFPMYEQNGWPGFGPGNPLRKADGSTDSLGANKTSRFMFATYGDKVPGANDPNRNYVIPAHYTDKTRTTLVYEAGWPTTAGVDMKLRVIQFTPNTQNLNDFVVYEISMTNTGIVDSDNDGVPEATDNDIDGITMTYDALATPSVGISTRATRQANWFGTGRTFGYIGTPDENGVPYDLYVWYTNIPDTKVSGQTVPPEGQRSFGIANYNELWGYDDIWQARRWMGVKQGAIKKDGPLNDILPTTPDKETLFGTDPIGKGAQRGWYTSNQWQGSLGASRSNSELEFHNATATWYEDYGKTSNGSDIPINLSPNSNFFASGQPDDMATWVPKANPGRPNGDFKLASEDLGDAAAFEEPVWEKAWNPAAVPGAPDQDFFKGTGFTRDYTFGESMDPGIGPFELKKGQSMTFVFVMMAGYRMQGVTGASTAAQWAWSQGFDIRSALPVPAAPDMEVTSTSHASAKVHWTDVSSITPIDGYKIWRASQYKRTKYLGKGGTRLLDHYQHQTEPGEDVTPFLDPVNPLYDDTTIYTSDIQGSYQPQGWGTYDLIANIPASEVSKYVDPDNTDGYKYSYDDTTAITGFTYWYYVSAYKKGTFTGPQGPVQGGSIESANFNRNGRNSPDAPLATIGLDAPWSGTYPFAVDAPEFPEIGTLAYKNMGASFTLTPPVAPVDQVRNLITVTPNPYKVTGLNDVRNDASSHNISFLNLPADYTLTILDVSGKIIFQTTAKGATNGKYTWDMFSKDGVEVASGLYIYVVEYSGRKVVGHFAILR